MAPPTPTPPARRFERGGVSWLTLLILAALAGAVYLAVVWGPVYVLHYTVRQTVREYANQAIKNDDDAALVERMCNKLATLETTRVVDEYGNPQTVPTVRVTPTDVTWIRDTTQKPPVLTVSFEYVREVHFPFINRVSEWVGRLEFTKELEAPDWGPAR